MLNEINLSRTDLNLLVVFEAVMQERHVGKAAAELNLTASAVSHSLGRLRLMFNDPLFLRTPKGVTPTARALELATPLADVLAQLKRVIAAAEPFDPKSSRRRFSIGAPDAISAIVIPALFAKLRKASPGIDISIQQLLPTLGETSPERAWQTTFAALDARTIDIAVVPSETIPARFSSRPLFREDFVIAMRRQHPSAGELTLERYCAARHLVVSVTGDPYGFVDRVLAQHGHARHVALTVPNFMFALAALGETDFLAALPRRFVALHGKRFNVVGVEPPLSFGQFQVNAIAPKVAMMDAGVAWLFDMVVSAG
jgi:DNA-binding transcriptional LysR family regulator